MARIIKASQVRKGDVIRIIEEGIVEEGVDSSGDFRMNDRWVFATTIEDREQVIELVSRERPALPRDAAFIRVIDNKGIAEDGFWLLARGGGSIVSAKGDEMTRDSFLQAVEDMDLTFEVVE